MRQSPRWAQAGWARCIALATPAWSVVSQSRCFLQISPLIPSRLDLRPTGQIGYDATPDGKRFIVNSPPAGNPPPITLVTNWKPALGKRTAE